MKAIATFSDGTKKEYYSSTRLLHDYSYAEFSIIEIRIEFQTKKEGGENICFYLHGKDSIQELMMFMFVFVMQPQKEE